jgi:isoleucyl-tRNA synthetase
MSEPRAVYPENLGGSDYEAAEAELRAFWTDADIFRRSEKERAGRPPFVFYEGPPTANGMPGVHHVITRLIKDVFCRYKTMTGHYVLRKGGWDTHGLPVEIEVEKALHLESKEDIERYGIEAFNAKCRESVFKYKKEWDEFTERIGFWLDLDDPYVTYENDYIESVWWILKQLWDKDLLYKGHKVVPYCTRCETALSSHEVALGYQDVDDPSVTVKIRAKGADFSFLVWTTTPWTLPSNVALAVGAEVDYVVVEHAGERYLLAEKRLGSSPS